MPEISAGHLHQAPTAKSSDWAQLKTLGLFYLMDYDSDSLITTKTSKGY